jgi:hypothetical protein
VLGLPADFLIDPAGRVVALRYGRHANDQWSVDELVELALPHGPASPKPSHNQAVRKRAPGASGARSRLLRYSFA